MSAVPHYHLVPKELRANLRFRRSLLEEGGRDPRAAAQIRRMCAEDLLFYVNAFCWTYDPRSSVPVTPFVTYAEFQDEAMLELVACVERGSDAAIPKSRDMGASWMGLTVLEWLWHFRANLSFLLVSRNEDYVDKIGNPKSLFWKIDFLHQNQPRWLLPEGRWLGLSDSNRKKLHLRNADTGSVIDGESTTGDAGRGDRRTAMFIDEHAAFELNDGFKVLRATRDTTKCRIFNSTPQGANNGFYEVVHKTNAKVLRLHWSKHPEKSRGLYTTDERTGKVKLLDDYRGPAEVRRKDEAPRVVRFPDEYPFVLDANDPKLRSPWYDGECARCVSQQEISQELDIDFLGSSYPFFDHSFVTLLRKRDARPPELVGDLEYDRETMQPKRFVENPKGLIQLWLPLGVDDRPSKDRLFVAGSDVSAGTGASNSATSIADRQTGEKLALLKTPHMQPREFAELTMALCYFFNRAYLVWDATGSTGQVFTNTVIKAAYPDIYYRKNEKKITKTVTDEPGYYISSREGKAVLLEDLRGAMADRTFVNRSDSGLAECLQFIRQTDGSVEHSAAVNSQDPSGARTAHGDEVIADAMCVVGLYERRSREESTEPKVPVGSLAWRIERRRAEAAPAAERLSDGW